MAITLVFGTSNSSSTLDRAIFSIHTKKINEGEKNMEFDNKTIVILGLIAIGLSALYCGNKDLALAIGSGLVGYLSKDAAVILSRQTADDDTDDII